MTRRPGDAWATGHLETIGHITGELELRGKRYTVDCYEGMDRSWGPREEWGGRAVSWLHDVVDSEHRYEIVEHADHRALLASLLELGPDDAAGARAVLDATAVVPDDLATLRGQTRDLKRAGEAAFSALTRDGAATATRARELMSGVARRQTARELAWARMTGFPQDVPGDVASVLAEQARDRPT